MARVIGPDHVTLRIEELKLDRRAFLASGGLFAVSTVAGSSFLVGCSTDSGSSKDGAAQNRDLRNLVYMTPFQQIISHADVYVAIQEGYFEEEGLFITPVGGTGTASSVSQVVAGQAFYGKAASIITCPLIADQKTEIITVGQKDQLSQYSVASDPSRPLKHPREWQGKTIGVISKGGTTELLLDAMSVAEGLDPKAVKKVVTGADVGSLEFLRRGEVDGFITFVGSEVAIRQRKIELHYLNTDEFAPMPGDSYFVKKSDAEKESEAVVGFLRACRKGWEFMENPSNTNKVLQAVGKFNKIEVSDVEVATAKVKAELKVSKPASGGYLSMKTETWQSALDLMRKSGIIKNTSRPVSDFMTTKFIDQV